MPPIESAITKNGSGAVQPSERNTRQVNRRVATVIPEIGFDDEPTSPVRRDETVTNKKPRITISIEPRIDTLGSSKKKSPSDGESMMAAINRIEPMITYLIE